MRYKVTFIPGDGIGPEVMSVARSVIEAAGVDVDWDVVMAGERAYIETGSPLPEETIESIRENKVALKGPLTTPIASGYSSVNVALRKIFDLYAIVRPVKSIPGLSCRYPNVDLILIREGTEGLYSGIEHSFGAGKEVAIALRVVTRSTCRRLAHFAFEYARKHRRRKVTLVHKANILKLTCGLMREEFFKVAENYPDLRAEEILVDNMAMQLVLNPEEYDVVLTSNMFGDILSDLAAGLIGTIGVSPSANIGDEYAIFEPTHGTAPQLAGRNMANPVAAVLAGAMLLEHLGEAKAASIIRRAVEDVIKEGKYITFDIAKICGVPPASTSQMGRRLVERTQELMES